MKTVSRALDSADIADGVAEDHALAHLVNEGFGVLEANQAAELPGINPGILRILSQSFKYVIQLSF